MKNLFRSILIAACIPALIGAVPSGAQHNYARVDGLDVYYETYGSGPPLVLIPGGGSTIEATYARIIPKLAKTHRLIAIEPQGEGHTRDRVSPPTFQRDADDIAGVLRHLGIANADVLGFSNGGHDALYLAIRHPQLVHRLILGSMNVRRDAIPQAMIDGLRHATPASMPPALREAYLKTAPDPSYLPEMVKRFSSRMANFQDVPEAEIRNLNMPTLLMYGDHDVFRPESFAEFYAMLPNAQLAVFPNSKHGQYLGEVSSPGPYPYVDDCAAIILNFLQEPSSLLRRTQI